MYAASRSLLHVLIALGGSATDGGAAEPAAAAKPQAAARATRRADAAPSGVAAEKPAPVAPPLDLKLGDASRYFPPGELATPLDERLEEIIVNGQRVEPIRDGRNVPLGLFPSLKHAATHPLDAWRILAPVPNFVIPDRSVDDPKDPPGSYRGRILEPGAIYD